MKKVLILGLLFVFTQSNGQSLHPNYKAQLNKKLVNKEITIVEINEIPAQEIDKKSTPKYRKNVVNVSFNETESNTQKHTNYKQHVPANGTKNK